MSSYKRNTHLMTKPNYKNLETKRVYDPQLWPSADKCTLNVYVVRIASLVCTCLLKSILLKIVFVPVRVEPGLLYICKRDNWWVR